MDTDPAASSSRPAKPERGLPPPPAQDTPEPGPSRANTAPQPVISRKPPPSSILRSPTSPALTTSPSPTSPALSTPSGSTPIALSYSFPQMQVQSPSEMPGLVVQPPPMIAMTGPSSQESQSQSDSAEREGRLRVRYDEYSVPEQGRGRGRDRHRDRDRDRDRERFGEQSPTLQPMPHVLPRHPDELRAPLERNLGFTGHPSGTQHARQPSTYLTSPPVRPTSRAGSHHKRGSTFSLHSARGGDGEPPAREGLLRRQSSMVDWIVPQAPQPPPGLISRAGSFQIVEPRERSIMERLQPTLLHAYEELGKARRKAKLTGYAINSAIGIEVVLGALTTGIAASTSGHETTTVIAILGGLSTLAASYLARARGSGQPDSSILLCRDLENYIRDLEGFMLDHGTVLGPEYDIMIAHYRKRFEEVLGNAPQDGKPRAAAAAGGQQRARQSGVATAPAMEEVKIIDPADLVRLAMPQPVKQNGSAMPEEILVQGVARG
ncbi:hypothetical protein CERSUDRAFT_154405 [Gelatoporia subvermispora B]|uniref:SMODS and SLOG-associating 2TM effector domain-containing protein n=1 Tax=Ceriporiopsis subvermispora (strain B) TaxID=914234 RepID=M2RFQ5_CERS8|nr:hypothetical protein CERSUDRAFT_154405 [Gelatoporia subvermispora B]